MKTHDIKIRKATRKDTDACISLCKTSRSIRRPKHDLWEKHIQQCIKNNRCLVVTHEKEAIWFVVRWQLRDKIHLQDMFIQENYRRMWIWQKMINKVIQIAKKAWYEEIISDCDIDNYTSINFHKKNWFQKTWRIKWHREWVDSYTFAKKI